MMHTSLFQTKVQHIITSTKSPLLGMEGREYLVHTVVVIQRVASHHNTTQHKCYSQSWFLFDVSF